MKAKKDIKVLEHFDGGFVIVDFEIKDLDDQIAAQAICAILEEVSGVQFSGGEMFFPGRISAIVEKIDLRAVAQHKITGRIISSQCTSMTMSKDSSPAERRAAMRFVVGEIQRALCRIAALN